MSDSISRAERRSQVSFLEYELVMEIFRGLDSFVVTGKAQNRSDSLKMLSGASYLAHDPEDFLMGLKLGDKDVWNKFVKVASEYLQRGAGFDEKVVADVAGVMEKAKDYVDVSGYMGSLAGDRKILAC